MNTVKMIVLSLLVLAAAGDVALAGEVYGKILDGAATVGEAASVEAKCGETAYPAQKTDKSGSFHLVLKETGKCSVTVSYKGQSASVSVASFDEAVQFDIVLETKDGKLTARRK